ncbi:hypothetical protein M3226_05225 [Neobacillus cucumis]|uniref:hypothetical protein n=1 Tax=Neobacillus cucumis TaxID=1740721 RepID=UPI002041116A|nr:hypothetical protein [Neobacillus cucumis]MCM3725099.1 hypothetical protein [Neobacillus cucumis]
MGEHSYLTSHDENAVIDYDYLYECARLVECWVEDKLTSNPKYKNLYNVTLDVKHWQIGSTIFTIENHETKQISRATSNQGLTMDEDIINTRGWILYEKKNNGSKKKEEILD